MLGRRLVAWTKIAVLPHACVSRDLSQKAMYVQSSILEQGSDIWLVGVAEFKRLGSKALMVGMHNSEESQSRCSVAGEFFDSVVYSAAGQELIIDFMFRGAHPGFDRKWHFLLWMYGVKQQALFALVEVGFVVEIGGGEYSLTSVGLAKLQKSKELVKFTPLLKLRSDVDSLEMTVSEFIQSLDRAGWVLQRLPFRAPLNPVRFFKIRVRPGPCYHTGKLIASFISAAWPLMGQVQRSGFVDDSAHRGPMDEPPQEEEDPSDDDALAASAVRSTNGSASLIWGPSDLPCTQPGK